MSSPDIGAFRLPWKPDARCGRLLLASVRSLLVEIDLADGNRISERVGAVRGTPYNPMSRAEVMEKARDLTPILGRDTSRLIETVFAIEAITDIRELRPLLQRG
jgi:hypothetical protein